MGYYGGKGVPFFGLYTFPGASDDSKDGAFAGRFFKLHKCVISCFTPRITSPHTHHANPTKPYK